MYKVTCTSIPCTSNDYTVIYTLKVELPGNAPFFKEKFMMRIGFTCTDFFFYNNFIAALDSNGGYMNSSELIQACNQAKLHNHKI